MAALQRLVAYERVSTARQGASGLGLQAQRQSIEAFATSRGAEVLARFTEVESGRKADRPELAKALHLAKVTGATLVIANLERLSRNAAFLLALRASGVGFLAVDMPEANDLTVEIMALVAQAEREAISRRTKEALAVAEARGVKLGNPNGAESLKRAGKGDVALRAVVSANAQAFAADLVPVLPDIREAGHTSLRDIAAELSARGIWTRRGGILGGGECEGSVGTHWTDGIDRAMHPQFRRRDQAMQRFHQTRNLQKLASVHASVHDQFNKERHLYSRQNVELARAAAPTKVLL